MPNRHVLHLAVALAVARAVVLHLDDDAADFARELQKQAAKFGFDWPDIRPVFDKLDEELRELRQAYEAGDAAAISDEVGDLLFVCINIARHAGVNAEMSLRGTNRKFQRRFAYVRERMAEAGVEMEQGQLELMEEFWQQAKGQVG